MVYISEPLPYRYPTFLMTPRELQKAFSLVMAQMGRRTENIARYLKEYAALEFSAKSSDEVVDRLPAAIASLGGLRLLSDLEFEMEIARSPDHAKEAMRSLLPREDLNEETKAMVFDAALLWGENFRARYPGARWEIGQKPRGSIYYGEPVLRGIEGNRWEFGVRQQLHGFVGRILLHDSSPPTPSEIMRMRAINLGLAKTAEASPRRPQAEGRPHADFVQ